METPQSLSVCHPQSPEACRPRVPAYNSTLGATYRVRRFGIPRRQWVRARASEPLARCTHRLVGNEFCNAQDVQV